MSEKTKARVGIVVEFVLSCVWHVFAGLYEYIKYVAEGWVNEAREAKKEWVTSDLISG